MPTNWGHESLFMGYDDNGLPRNELAAVGTITCPTCDETAVFRGSRSERQSGHEVAMDGRTVNEVFRFVGARGRYTTSCRACERTARSRAAAASVGSGRRFGVEIECNVPEDVGYSGLAHAIRQAGVPVYDEDEYYSEDGDYDHNLPRWVVKGDGSLGSYGVEVCSPPLSGPEGHEQLRLVCRALTEAGCTVDSRCGLHVHHDIRGARTTVEAVKRFVRTWYENQGLIDGLVSQSRREAAGPTYCRALTISDMQRIEAVTRLEDLHSVDRYRTVNVTSYPSHGTIEVRQHQGTLDSEKITSWVHLGQAMLDDAEARQAARPRAASVEDFLDRMGSHLNDTAKTYLIGRAVRFAHAPVTARMTVLA